MASMASMQKMLSMYQPGGDAKTIDQYSNVGDWAQNKGYGTLKTISDLLSKFSGLQAQDQAQQQDQLSRNALISYGQKIGALQPDIPNKIDTTGTEIPFQQNQNPNTTANPVSTTQNGLTPQQMNSATMNPEETSQLPQYDKMSTPSVMNLLKLGMPQKPFKGGTGNPALDKVKAAVDVLKANAMDQYVDPDRWQSYINDLDSARKAYFGNTGTVKAVNDQAGKYFKKGK